MNFIPQRVSEFAPQASSHLLDVLIRASLIGALALLCFRIFSPFLPLLAWSIILAVTLYPLHQRLARRLWGKQWLASSIVVIIGLLIIIIPMALLMNSFADSLRHFIGDVQQNTLTIPQPREGIQRVPLVGKKVFGLWSKAHTDLPGFIQTMRPKLSELAQWALGMVAKIGSGLLLFIVSFIVGSILMAYGESGQRATRSFFIRVAGPARGEALAKLSTATIRAVALGVIGIAFIQAALIGLALLIAGVPAAGVFAVIALVLGIAQVPALVITIPAIIYIWASGNYSTGAAVTYTIILLVAGMADNVLKPLMLGRGVDAPMPVILLGALGGMASGGILGMFVGATLAALGYQIFMGWVTSPESDPAVSESKTPELASAATKA